MWPHVWPGTGVADKLERAASSGSGGDVDVEEAERMWVGRKETMENRPFSVV